MEVRGKTWISRPNLSLLVIVFQIENLPPNLFASQIIPIDNLSIKTNNGVANFSNWHLELEPIWKNIGVCLRPFTNHYDNPQLPFFCDPCMG